MLKKILISVCFLSLPLASFAEELEQGCKMKCHEKEMSQRGACRDERRQCFQKNFDKHYAKMSEKGIPADKKQKMIERMTKRIEMIKAQSEDMTELTQQLQQNLEKVKSLKEKEAKK